MVVAMVAVRVVKSPVHQEVSVVPVWDPFVSAVLIMVALARGGLTLRRVCLGNLDSAFVKVPVVLLVQVTVVNVIHMIAVPDLRVPAGCAVLVPMSLVNLMHP